MLNGVAAFAATVLGNATKRRNIGDSAVGAVAKSIVRLPIKAVAAYFCAPFLAFRVARHAKNPVRRIIAGMGLFIAMLAAWAAGTFLGSLTGALLVAAKIGLLAGWAFLVGTSVSVVLSITFQLSVLNAFSLFFLHMSSEEVVQYLKELSD